MGPLLFLVMLVPFTVNGLAVRESFFVCFLGRLGVGSDTAFATGLPLLRGHARCSRCPGGGSSPGRACAAGAAPARRWLTSPSSSSPTTRCPGSSSASRACAAYETSSSTTARPTARSSSSASASRGAARRAGEPRPRLRLEHGHARTPGRYVLLLNSDAWLDRRALEALVAFAEDRPDAAVVGPRLRYPDGPLQRSVRGFPTLWRLATEFFFLRKLAPRHARAERVLRVGFDHDEVREAEFLMGACLLVRREAADTVGLFDEDFFMFSEETDWLYRFRQAGWKVLFYPGAEFVHVGGATTSQNWGPMYREQLRGHLRFLAKHGSERDAERARRLLLASMRLRSVAFRGPRRKTSREAARWLARQRAGPAGGIVIKDRIAGAVRPAAIVVDVGWVNGLAAIRSLGRAGMPVIAVDHRESALGFRSRYAVPISSRPAGTDALRRVPRPPRRGARGPHRSSRRTTSR